MRKLLIVLFVLLARPVLAQSHSVTIAWTPSTSTVTGYNMYRASVSGGPYTKLTPAPVPVSPYVDTSVTANSTVYYVATAVNTAGESVDSNEVSATIPADPVTPPQTTLIPPSNPATFSPAAGTRVGLLVANNVRATASLSGTLYGQAPAGALGTVTSVPAVNSNQGWIYVQVKFDSCTWGNSTIQANGCVGWTGGDELGTVSGSTPPPPPPPPPPVNPTATCTTKSPFVCTINPGTSTIGTITVNPGGQVVPW